MKLIPAKTTTTLAALAATAALSGCSAIDFDSSSGRIESAGECGFYTANLIKHGGEAVGSATITDDGENLLVEMSTDEGFNLWYLAVHAGAGPVPDSGGVVSPSWFAHSIELGDGSHDPAQYPTSYTMEIPLAEIGVEAGTCTDINVSVYARVKKFSATGSFLGYFRTWVEGPESFPVSYNQHLSGYSFDYTFCCEDEDEGCTLTQGYWKTHNEFATSPGLISDWPAPYDEDELMCGETLLDIMHTKPKGNAWYILAHQYIASSLNVAAGASSPADVASALADAGDLLLATCDGMSDEQRADAIALKDILDAYNNGDIGPGHCD